MISVRRPLRAGLLAAFCLPLLSIVEVPAAPGPAYGQGGSTPDGAAGIGDPYWPLDGNGGIDVASYAINQNYNLRKMWLRGRTRLKLTATATQRTFNLDFLLPVQKVVVDGDRARFKQRFHELTIRPKASLTSGRSYVVTVKYAGSPKGIKYAGENNWLANEHEVLAVNQPHMAPWWFPSNDHPSDKATVAVTTRVARGREVIGNGELVKHKRTKRYDVWRWRSATPMATYLAFFAAGDFEIDRDRVAGLRVINAVSTRLAPKDRKAARRFLAPTGAVVHQLAADLGPYPFRSTGGLVTSLLMGFALENQTRPVYPFVGRNARGLLVHELAHQWFGDSVAVARWRDIWLNEGGATFMEWRDAELRGGDAAAKTMRVAYDSFGATDEFWSLSIADPGAAHVFDDPVYLRGAMTMQALRNRIGDDAFFSLLRAWTNTKAGGNGTSEEFEALAAQVSGVDLTTFFTAWLRTPAKPAATPELGLG